MHAVVLRYFEAVAEEGSIRRAAERLHISPSAVNRQILKLEEHFGTPLFERRPDGMRLTDAGWLVLRHIRDTLQGFSRLRGEIGGLHGVVSGNVTIATVECLTGHFLPELLRQFITSEPMVRIRAMAVDPLETMQAVLQGNADVGLTYFPARGRGVEVLADISCQVCAIMTPGHDLAAHGTLTLDQCAEYRLVYQEHAGSMRVFFGEEMEAFRNAHEPVVITNDHSLLKHLLLGGAGIGFYTRLGFGTELAEGRLVAVPLEGERFSNLRLCLIVASDRVQTVAARALANHLTQALLSIRP